MRNLIKLLMIISDMRQKAINDYVQGQILLVTLLVLTIMAIIVVGVVSIVTQDVEQTFANEEYERLYAIAESRLLEVIDKYGDTQISLAELLIDYSATCSRQGLEQYQCTFAEQDGIETRLIAEDISEVDSYDLEKDQSLVLQLNGYRGIVSMAWVGNTALEYSLVYSEDGKDLVINDIFDQVGIFDSTGNDPLFDSAPGNHPFPFERDPNKPGWIRFSIGGIEGLPANSSTASLRITARQQPNISLVTQLSISGGSGFPDQIRELTASSFNRTNNVDTVASVGAQIPIDEQVLPIFHYALGTQGSVVK